MVLVFGESCAHRDCEMALSGMLVLLLFLRLSISPILFRIQSNAME